MIAITIALSFAATHLIAVFGTFPVAFEGELWGVRHEMALPDAGEAAGLAYSNGTLFVADTANKTIVAYDSAGAVVLIDGAEWVGSEDPSSPTFKFTPSEILAVTVKVDNVDTAALLVSDAESSHRVMAFSTAGAHLFTLQLERPGFVGAAGAINGMAVGPGAQFSLTTTPAPALELAGSFAAGWANEHETLGAVLAYGDGAVITYSAGRFEATATATLDGTEGVVTPQGQVLYGLTFDPAGNLYAIDTNTERLNVYNSAFVHQFTFGTPVVDGTLAEFAQPYGLIYSPAAGGRLLIGDSDHHRVLIYRPDLANETLEFVSSIEVFGDGLPRSVALDAATGRLAVSGAYAGTVWMLETPDLAAFDLKVLNAAGQPAEELCAGAPYQVRFSLTVPAGRRNVTGVVPQLSIGGNPVTGATPLNPPYSNSMRSGDVATYVYQLVMPAVVPVGGFSMLAGATASTTNVLFREGILDAANCVGSKPTVSARANIEKQISGWTPVRPDETFTLTLEASDVEGIAAIEYQISGQNDPGSTLDPVPNPSEGTTQTLVLSLPELDFSTINYRAIDTDNRKSPWQQYDLLSVPLTDRFRVEGDLVEFTVGYPIGVDYRFRATGLPDGITIHERTGQISGRLNYITAGTYTVEVTEDTGPGTPWSSVKFNWVVANHNRHPEVAQPNASSIVEGQPFSLQIVASDPDQDPIWYAMVGVGRELPPGIIINPTTGLIEGEFPFNSARDYNIQITVVECGPIAPVPPCAERLEGRGLATVVNSPVSVINFNRPPTIVNPDTRSNDEGDVVELPIRASDPDIATDGQVLTYRASNLPPGLTMHPVTGVISGTISYNALPTYAVTIGVDDAEAPPTFQVFNWLVRNANAPPVALPDAGTVNKGESVVMTVLANDTDADGVSTLSVVSVTSPVPGGTAVLNANGTITYTATTAYAGPVTFSYTITDGTEQSTALVTVTVINRAPNVVNPGNQLSNDGASVTLNIGAGDPDGDALTYSATGLPPGLSINAATGVVSGTLDPNALRTHTVTVTASDGSLSDSETFTWTVRKPPTARPDGATVLQGQSVVISMLANDTDPDGDSTISIQSVGQVSQGSVVINANGTVTYTANATFAGTATFSYTITDGTFTSSALVTITVQANRAPICSATVAADDLWPPNQKPHYLSLVGITDPDGDAITIGYTAILQDEPVDSDGLGSTPDGGIEDGGARAWVRSERTGKPSIPGDGRVYIVSYTATDPAGASCSGTTSLGVRHDQRGTPAVLSPGRWNSLDGQQVYAPPPDAVNDVASVKKGQSVTIAVLGNDVLTYQPVVVTIVGAPSTGTATTNGQTITYTAPNTVGAATLTYRVTGPFGSDTATVTIAIR